MASRKAVLSIFVAVLTVSNINSAVDSTFHCYLLFGQSNMAGGGAGVPLGGSGSGTFITADCDTSPRVKVLAFCDCASGVSGAACKYNTLHTHDTWYTARPALHICNEGVSPGDWFAKTMLDSIRSDIKIGLIPCALSGQALNVFFPGGSNFNIPTWAHPTLVNGSPYAWMLARCKLAQQTGVIKGILLHQGESGAGTPPNLSWIAMTTAIMDSLKKNLGLPSTLPVAVGELRQTAGSCCAGFNTNIDQFASQYPDCGLASSADLTAQTSNSDGSTDPYHFDPPGMRELGKRYAIAILQHASATYIPRKGASNTINDDVEMYQKMRSPASGFGVYSLTGQLLRSFTSTDAESALRRMNTGGVYLVRFNDGHSFIVPSIKK